MENKNALSFGSAFLFTKQLIVAWRGIQVRNRLQECSICIVKMFKVGAEVIYFLEICK